jgi:thioesterase domain-containing protein
MTADVLQSYLHEHIPLSAAMGATVVRSGPGGVRLGAPLEPNLNHRATAFGGSVAALAILAGWALVHLRLRSEGVEARTVVQRSDIRYVHAIEGAFEARAAPPGQGDWRRFRTLLDRWGRGRIRIRVEVWWGGAPAAVLDADYVSLVPSSGS